MSLLDLLKTSPSEVQEKQVQQLIAFAGEGQLRDGNAASREFREFLGNVLSFFLHRYAEECLKVRFDGSGFALQDIVNEIGSRLGFMVSGGRYRGITTEVGFDGLWRAPEGNHIIVEVKTTDAYRIDLDTLAGYRRAIIRRGDAGEDHSSILIVVGRQDTGDLEAQIRGSKHAWDIRLISVDALLGLLKIKEEVEDPKIEIRIRSILVPREYTRVDEIIELVFSTTEDIRHEDQPEEAVPEAEEAEPQRREFSPVSFHDACATRIQSFLGQTLIKRSRVTFTSPDNSFAVICAVSREYEVSSGRAYWFAFHPHQKAKLEAAAEPFVAFGCGSPAKVVLIPFKEFAPWLGGMNQTHREDGSLYWHVQIFDEGGRLILHRRKGEDWPELTRYLIQSGSGQSTQVAPEVRTSSVISERNKRGESA